MAEKTSPSEAVHGEGTMTVCAEVSDQYAITAFGHVLTARGRLGLERALDKGGGYALRCRHGSGRTD